MQQNIEKDSVTRMVNLKVKSDNSQTSFSQVVWERVSREQNQLALVKQLK